jgi:hypothetical protein
MIIATSPKRHAHHIGLSANNKRVYANLMSKPLSENVSNNPHLLRFAEEAVAAARLAGEIVQFEHVIDHDIGRSELIETNETDIIFYARQTKTSGYTRFVKNRQSLPTDRITVSLLRDSDGEYEITGIWIGTIFPAAPDHATATDQSADFWSTHAIVYSGQPIISNSLTKSWPY